MGLLDDAIRQHLELKRRHGADPGDVARLEHEALGPVQREDALAVPEPEDVPPAPPALDDHEAADAAVAHEEELAYEEAELEADERWEHEHPAPPPPAPLPVVPEPAPEPPLPPAAGRVRAQPGPPHAEEPDPQPDAEPGEHDELEETPEFLQETPEHDRLWFEQKPPRDFDF